MNVRKSHMDLYLCYLVGFLLNKQADFSDFKKELETLTPDELETAIKCAKKMLQGDR